MRGGLTFFLLTAVALGGCLERRDNDTAQSQEGCTECHGGKLAKPFEAAPPFNLDGSDDPKARGNGAHASHLMANDRALQLVCSDCHTVPSELYSPGHVDTTYPAEVIITSSVASAYEATPRFDAKSGTCKNTFCHGGYFVGGRPSGGTTPEPSWTRDLGVAGECGACHGLPPPAPHPEAANCSDCHHDLGADNRTFLYPALHVDGTVTFYLPGSR